MSDKKEHVEQLPMLKRALHALDKMQAKLDELERSRREAIAIIGMGCRFPGSANTPEQFWRVLCDEVDTLTEIPRDRWNIDAFYDTDPHAPGKMHTRYGAFLKEIDKFDPTFFGISPREAIGMDPQQRLLLEVSWEALEHAGQVKERLIGSETGVFIGIMSQEYARYYEKSENLKLIDAYYCTGNDFSFAPGRISYTFGLQGPSIAIDTACSSSLVAVHLACQSLRSGECDMALAGGVSLILSPELNIFLSKTGAMSPDGRCKTFDASANGMGRGEGCGVVVLKRLSSALADGDTVLALIRGSAVNHDGPSGGLTVPNGLAQQALLRRALANAQIEPSQVGYVEAHGTGTILGDPIELVALNAVFSEGRQPKQPLLVGSVKTNIGHLDPAAGIAGLIKTVLALQHAEIPRHLHLKHLNPHIDWDNFLVDIPTARRSWPASYEKRVAGVSAFGLSGVNAHVILQEAALQEPFVTAISAQSQIHFLPLSAHNSETLQAVAQSYQPFLEKYVQQEYALADIYYTASVRRTHHEYRLVLMGNSAAEMCQQLSSFLEGDSASSYSSASVAPGGKGKLAFVFSGQGAQWLGMGCQLLAQEGVFRQVMERCDAIFHQYAGWSLLEALHASEADYRFDQTDVAQPLLVAIEVALAALWQSWGIIPDAVVGHSLGEIAAAHVAGVLSLEDALLIVFHRSRLMQKATGQGKMLLVHLPEAQVQSFLAGRFPQLAVAAINNPAATVVSGAVEEVEVLLSALQQQDVACQLLSANYAFHSLQMDPFKDELIEALQGLTLQPAVIPIISTVTACNISGNELIAEYWARNMRDTVLFAPAIEVLLQEEYTAFLEIGPHPVLMVDVKQCLRLSNQDGIVLPSLRRRQDERSTLFSSLATLYCSGYPIEWKYFYKEGGRCVTLPAYPWQRERLWIADHLEAYATQELSVSVIAAPKTQEDIRLTPEQYLAASSDEVQHSLLLAYLRHHIARIFRVSEEKLSLHLTLQRMGMDSLTALELRNRIEHDLGVTVPLVQLLQGTTIQQLQAFISTQLLTATGAGAFSVVKSEPQHSQLEQEVRLPAITLAARDVPIPLSFAQQRLWFLDQLDTQKAAYNECIALRLQGDLNVEELTRSLGEIIRRHEILRTNIVMTSEIVAQRIAPFQSFTLPQVDLGQYPVSERETQAMLLINGEVSQLFDLSRDALLRLKLIRLDDQEHILLIVLHHIICDGWSVEIFARELTVLYTAFVRGEPSPLPELPIQYADYSIWQHQWLRGNVLDSQLAYWKRQLGGTLPLLELPTDHPRPALLNYSGARHYMSLSPALTTALKQLSLDEDVTLFMTLLAAFQTLLYRYSSQEDIIVGSPISNRNRAETETLIGFIVNMLVLRIDFSGNPTFRQLLRRVRQIALNAYVHQHVPFEKLVEELQPERQLNRYPLVQVAFTLQGAMTSEVRLPDLSVTTLDLQNSITKVDLEMQMWEVEGGIKGQVTYSTELFEAATIASMMDHFVVLLENLVVDPALHIADIGLLTAAEQEQMLVSWNQSVLVPPVILCAHQLVEASAEQTPAAISIIDGEASFTYEELNRRANQIAHYLRALHVEPETLVAVCMERSFLMIAALLGILKAGGAYVPLDPSYPPERLAFMIHDAQAPVVLTQTSLMDLFSLNNDSDINSPDVIYLDQQWDIIVQQPDYNVLGEVELKNLAYVIYTSGSTGLPKGVTIDHAGLLNLITWHQHAFAMTSTDRATHLSGLGFDAAVWELWPYLATGSSISLLDNDTRIAPALLSRWLIEHAITICFLPTPLAEGVLALPWPQDGHVRTLLTGGDRLHVYPSERFPFVVINNYGPTESSVVATSGQVSLLASTGSPPCIGRPISNTQVYILNPQLQPVPIGVPGELYIGGAGLARGYMQRPDLTAERFLPHPFSKRSGERLYRTGDIVRYIPDGTIDFVGRVDHQVKIRGFRIELGEVEQIINQHPGILESVALMHNGATEAGRLTAYVVLDPEYQSVEEILDEEKGEYISEWQTLYDETYSDSMQPGEATFNITGWNSSYTGSPISADEMREQIDQTVERILALQPECVLEIGFGTGLILFRVAPYCSYYQASDFSAVALNFVQQQLSKVHIPQVTLHQNMADDFAMVAPASFDLVVLNSIIQYFPSMDYLLQVLDGSLHALRPGGAIFIGDIRNQALLGAYHTSVEFYRADAALTREALYQQIQKRIKEQEEFLVTPDFFTMLTRSIEQPSLVQMQLKRGHAHNELTRFRYDILIRTGATEVKPSDLLEVDWQEQGMTIHVLRQLLIQDNRTAIRLKCVPDARLHTEVKTIEWLSSTEEPQTVGEFRAILQGMTDSGVDPELLWQLGEEFAYATLITATESSIIGCYDVLFQRNGLLWGACQPVPLVANCQLYDTVRAQSWSAYTNDPLRSKMTRKILPQLRSFLQTKLPEYMLPSAFMVLDAFPVTPNGKIDRRAFPSPDQANLGLLGTFVAPRTPLEKSLSEIWSDLLGIGRIAVHDNFFALGGHSLLATQFISVMRTRLQVDLPLRCLWETPTIAGLAERVESALRLAIPSSVPAIAAISRDDSLELSFAQRRLWFLHQLEPESPAYIMPAAMQLQGKLDIAALQYSLAAIVQRHEALRTTFHTIQGRPVQIITPVMHVPLLVIDLTSLAEDSREPVLLDLARQQNRWPFDLTQGPLLRITLLRVRCQQHILVNSLHHIIADGWSVGIIIKELAAFYSAFVSSTSPTLSVLPLHYADYALWQRRWLQGEVLEMELAYWKKQLTALSPMMLPTDRPRPVEQTYRGAVQRFVIAQELSQQLQALCRNENVTLFMALLAAFQLMLARYASHEDIVVGTDIANRDMMEIENIVGFFVNTLVLRTNVSEASSFHELLIRVREVCLGAYAHQHLPFEKLVDELHPERDLSRNPLFQIHFTLQNSSSSSITMNDVTVRPFEIHNATAKFDLSLRIIEHKDDLEGVAEYCTDLFDAATIARMLTHFQVILHALVTDPATSLTRFALLTPAEHQQMLISWNETTRAFPLRQCFHTSFAEQVAHTPDATAAICQGRTLTYRELDLRANQLAHLLRHHGVGFETLVGLYMHRSLEMLVSILAIFKAGGAYVPLDPGYPQERICMILDDAQVHVLITQPELTVPPVSFALDSITLDADWSLLERYNKQALPNSDLFQQLAYVIYTSGSTGRPKGAMITHQGMLNHLYAKIDSLQLQAQDRLAQTASHCFDISVWQFLAALLIGGQVHILPDEVAHDPWLLAEYVTSEQVTVLELVPSFLRAWLELSDQYTEQISVPSTLRWLVVTGEACSSELACRWFQRYPHIPLVNAYGPTECSDDVTHAVLYDVEAVGEKATLPLGRAIANTQLYVLDRYLFPVPIGVAGEVFVGGNGVGRGYLKQAERTALAFVPDPFATHEGSRLYCTGDLARYLPDGQIEFLGRIDQQVKVRGYRIELEEIEAVVEQHPAVHTCVVVLAHETTVSSKRLIAYVVPCAPGEQLIEAELRSFLRSKLPEYMLPSRFITLDALPLTPNGKLDRQALLASGSQYRETADAFVAPSTIVEAKLAEIWADIFGVSTIGVRDNFFALGGDSILSIQIIARANQVGLRLTPKQLFRYQTIEELSQVVDTTPVVLAEQEMIIGSVPLTPIQHWFFSMQFHSPHHWNQSVLLEIQQPVDVSALQDALRALHLHHDALRLRFKQQNGAWQQEIVAPEDHMLLTHTDLVHLSKREEETTMRGRENAMQTSLHLTAGPLLRAELFTPSPDWPALLLIVTHHLVVDGISWRILLEDLQTAYQQLSKNQVLQLPPKTTSFKQWAEHLAEYADSETVRKSLSYWVKVGEQATPLPIDYPAQKDSNLEATTQVLSAALTPQETKVLLEMVPSAYQTHMNEVLLTALAQTFQRWMSVSPLFIDLEGHGREDLFTDVDVARTIGWFTIQYPVLLDIAGAITEADALKRVKEQLRRMSNRGPDYGLLRYLSNDSAIVKTLEAVPQAEILFNYLGQLGQERSSSARFILLGQSIGPLHSPEAKRSHLLEINCFIQGGQFQIDWLYSTHFHAETTMRKLITGFIEALRLIIAHCQSEEAGGYTPSDFPDVELSQEQLEMLLSQVHFDETI